MTELNTQEQVFIAMSSSSCAVVVVDVAIRDKLHGCCVVCFVFR